jgi:hypothetical protein
MTTLAPTLYNRTFPRMAGWLRDSMLVSAGALFVAVLAQVKIPLPFTPVPLTGQTFAVLLAAATLGSKRGAASMALSERSAFPYLQAARLDWHISAARPSATWSDSCLRRTLSVCSLNADSSEVSAHPSSHF